MSAAPANHNLIDRTRKVWQPRIGRNLTDEDARRDWAGPVTGTGTINAFLRRLRESNRAAIGARVTIRAAGVKQFSEVHGGSSYLSQNDLRLHFGLGTAKKMESVEIRWPSGKVETLENVAADAIYTIIEGAGIRETKALPPPANGAPNGGH